MAGKSRGAVAAMRSLAEGDALPSVLTGRRLAGNVARAAVLARPPLLTLALVRASSVVTGSGVLARRLHFALVDVVGAG